MLTKELDRESVDHSGDLGAAHMRWKKHGQEERNRKSREKHPPPFAPSGAPFAPRGAPFKPRRRFREWQEPISDGRGTAFAEDTRRSSNHCPIGGRQVGKEGSNNGEPPSTHCKSFY